MIPPLPPGGRLLVQNGVKEVLHCAGGSAGWPKARKVLERVNCVVTERKRAEFATADIEQVRLLRCNSP